MFLLERLITSILPKDCGNTTIYIFPAGLVGLHCVHVARLWYWGDFCQKLPPCPEPMPASSKRDPLLAKDQDIRNGGSATRMMYLRRRKMPWQLQLGERNEKM